MTRENLKNFRKSINESPEEMAKKLDISTSMYKQMECGAKNPSLKTMQRFQNCFPSVDIGKIFL